MKTGNKDVLQSELREEAAGCGKCSCQAGSRGRRPKSGGRTDKVKTEGKTSLRKQEVMMKSQGTVGGTNSRLEENPLSLPGGLQRKEAGQRKVYAMQGWGGLLGENVFDNLLASRPSLPAKLSQSLFNGKASPKGSRCGWNQFKCEGAGASSGSLPHFFSSFFFLILQVPSGPPTRELHPGLLPGDNSQDCIN